jgi:hypothetical protein
MRVLPPLFSPYGPDPYRSLGAIRRQVCTFLFEELLRWLIHSGQLDLTQRPGQRRFADFQLRCRSP